jgi:ER lumen protein retaining receptor
LHFLKKIVANFRFFIEQLPQRLRVRPASANGISLCMLQMYVIVYAMRLYANLRFEDYLPVDSVGDWAYQCVDLCSLGMVIYIMHFVWRRRQLNIYGEESSKERFPVLSIAVLCLVTAFFVRPGRIQDTIGDMSWVAAHYLEAFVMVPQLMLVTRNAEVEAFTAHSIACVYVYFNLKFIAISQ